MSLVEELVKEMGGNDPEKIATFADLVRMEFPEPDWIVPGILPAGLTILAGPPKKGKSWMALELALAVAAGGFFLGRKALQGRVLYVALEDSARRLKARILKQGWSATALENAKPIFAQDFHEQFAGKEGAAAFAAFLANSKYALVVLDTLSRAFRVRDWNDVGAVTATLAPLQEAATGAGKAVLVIDHHRKPNGFVADALTDILGSTAKGAVADVIWGLYREPGKPGARLVVDGRDVEQQELNLRWDAVTGCWQESAASNTLTDIQRATIEIMMAFEGGATLSELAAATGRNRGNLHKELQKLLERGLVAYRNGRWISGGEET